MPQPGDPSYDRQQRAARARQAASDASGERLAELREKYLAPAKPARGAAAAGTRDAAPPATARPRATVTTTTTPRPPSVPKPHPLDTAGIARTGRAALDKHPGTWTSYAELCSAMGMTRSSAGAMARQHIFEPTGSHWFRIRSDDGVYEPPTTDEGIDEPVQLSPAEADAQLTGIGVTVVDGRADPLRKLGWNGSAWTLPGSD